MSHKSRKAKAEARWMNKRAIGNGADSESRFVPVASYGHKIYCAKIPGEIGVITPGPVWVIKANP